MLKPDTATSRGRRQMALRGLGGLLGAALAFSGAYLLYQWLNPILEDRTDWIRELQGFLFTVVPLSTACGAALGWWIVGRFQSR
jgi:cell division protein FtsX